MGKIVAIAIPKGGVGKTTTAVNLAASLAVFEKRTLLIDTDPFGACSLSLGFTKERTVGGLFEVFNFTHSLSKYIDWIREVANRSLALEGVVQTMYEPNTKVTDITERELQLRFRKHLLKTVIPKNTQLVEASFYGKPAVLFNANSKGTLAYLQLAREILERNSAAIQEKPELTQTKTG